MATQPRRLAGYIGPNPGACSREIPKKLHNFGTIPTSEEHTLTGDAVTFCRTEMANIESEVYDVARVAMMDSAQNAMDFLNYVAQLSDVHLTLCIGEKLFYNRYWVSKLVTLWHEGTPSLIDSLLDLIILGDFAIGLDSDHLYLFPQKYGIFYIKKSDFVEEDPLMLAYISELHRRNLYSANKYFLSTKSTMNKEVLILDKYAYNCVLRCALDRSRVYAIFAYQIFITLKPKHDHDCAKVDHIKSLLTNGCLPENEAPAGVKEVVFPLSSYDREMFLHIANVFTKSAPSLTQKKAPVIEADVLFGVMIISEENRQRFIKEFDSLAEYM